MSSIYGVGLKSSSCVCRKLGFSLNLKVKSLTKNQVSNLIVAVELENIILSTNLKKSRLLINKRLVDIKSYRGLRKLQGLPVRGQRTHTNAKSSRKVK